MAALRMLGGWQGGRPISGQDSLCVFTAGAFQVIGGMTMILVSHEMRFVREVSTRAVFESGKI
jgi:hypothetical protein